MKGQGVLKTTMRESRIPNENPHFMGKMHIFVKQYYAGTAYHFKAPTLPLEGEQILCM